ncbi:MAG TPA: glycosyltransferase [Nitriliruptorales bacterium]|nr:glycosyltransferase [Nitriliruptorales bacterium]
MLARRPCVTTDVGQIRAAVGDAAVVVPPDDIDALTAALAALVNDAAARRRLGDRAATLAHRPFDVRRTVAEIVAIYRAALDQAKAGRISSA